jgi:hypothetical protein
MYDPERSKAQYAKGSASMFCCSDCEADFNDEEEEEKPREDEQTCDECGDCGDFILHKSKVKEEHFVCCICKKAEEQ